MKILLLASLFPPVRHTGALRWTRLCRRLGSMGCDFHVVTTTSGFWSSQHEDVEPLPNILVERVAYPNNLAMAYLKFMHWGIKKFKQRSSSQNMSASSEMKESSQPSILSRISHGTLQMVKKLSQLPQARIDEMAFPHYSKYWAKSVVKHCARNLDPKDFDVIVATHPYSGTLLAAKELSRVFGLPWVADFRDPWTHDMQSPYRGDTKKIDRMWAFEGEVLKTAAAVVSINRQMCDFLNTENDKTHVITNSFDELEYESIAADPITSNGVLNLCYTGSIAEDHEYRLFLDGMKKCQDRGCDAFVLNYYGGHFEWIVKYAKAINLEPSCLVNHGFVKHEDANRKLKESDCGVVFGWKGPLAKLVATGKIFDTLGVGAPILGVCSVSGSAMQDIIEQSGAGMVLHGVDEIADFLNAAVEAKNRNQLMEFVAPDYSASKKDGYTTKSIAKAYKAILEAVVGNH